MNRDLSQPAAPTEDVGVPSAAALEPAGVEALVETLRNARLTVLIGATGSGKSRLLQEAVRPLLRRRADDVCTQPAPLLPMSGPGSVDLLERRRRRARPRELVVWCDRWDGSPTERLHACLDEAVGAEAGEPGLSRAPIALRVDALGAERGARLLFVFDHGDRLAPARADGSGAAAEYDALLNTLCGLGPSVHVLVSAPDDALPPAVRSRLDRDDTRVLRLPDRRRTGARALPPTVATVWSPPSEPDGRPLQRDDVYESIIARLAAIDDGEREPPWGSAASTEAATGGVDGPPAAWRDDPKRPLAAGWRTKTAARLAGWRLPGWPLSRTGLACVALLATAAVGVLRWQDRAPPADRLEPPARVAVDRLEPPARGVAADRLEPPARGGAADRLAESAGGSPGPAALPAPARPAPARPAPARPAPTRPETTAERADAGVEAAQASRAPVEPGSDAEVAGQLWRQMAAHGGPVAGDEAVRTVSAGQPLAIVSYDTLRTLAGSGIAKTARVIAPLYVEELQVLVRADSPLAFIHEIRDRRINVGAAKSRRGTTAAATYRLLFDAPLSPGKTSTAELGPALAELLDQRSLDAIVLVEPQPSVWLAGLSDVQRRGLKVLRLAPDAPSTRRALRATLPATLHSALGGPAREVPTLGVMSFLIANAAPPGAGAAPPGAGAARALCQALAVLRRGGHPVWQAVDPALRLPLPLPYDDGAAAVLENCETPRSTASPRTSISVSQADSPSKGEHE